MPKLYPAPLTDGDVEAIARYVETFKAKGQRSDEESR
jgi:hypothetical protein